MLLLDCCCFSVFVVVRCWYSLLVFVDDDVFCSLFFCSLLLVAFWSLSVVVVVCRLFLVSVNVWSLILLFVVFCLLSVIHLVVSCLLVVGCIV